MNVRHALACGLGNDAVDQTDRRRVVRAVEQVVGGRNIGGQYVQFIRADVDRPSHGGGAALHRIMIGQMPVELRRLDEAHVEAAGKMATHLQQHARIAALAHRDRQSLAILRQHHHAMLAGKAIRNVDRSWRKNRRHYRHMLLFAHFCSPLGGRSTGRTTPLDCRTVGSMTCTCPGAGDVAGAAAPACGSTVISPGCGAIGGCAPI